MGRRPLRLEKYVLFVKALHIIAAMVYFGLPFTFGRWFRSVSLGEEIAPREDALAKMRLFGGLHLNLCAALVAGSGLWLARPYGHDATWIWASLTLLGLSALNLNLNLLPVLRDGWSDDRRRRIRIALFSATHHTLVTGIILLMVWKPA